MVIDNDGICPHECIATGCGNIVQFDDEPWCFTHSPDDGSSLPGWSARQALMGSAADVLIHQKMKSVNVFDKNSEGG